MGGRQIWYLKDLPEITLAKTQLGWQIFAPLESQDERVQVVRESRVCRQAFRSRSEALEVLEVIL